MCAGNAKERERGRRRVMWRAAAGTLESSKFEREQAWKAVCSHVWQSFAPLCRQQRHMAQPKALSLSQHLKELWLGLLWTRVLRLGWPRQRRLGWPHSAFVVPAFSIFSAVVSFGRSNGWIAQHWPSVRTIRPHIHTHSDTIHTQKHTRIQWGSACVL